MWHDETRAIQAAEKKLLLQTYERNPLLAAGRPRVVHVLTRVVPSISTL